MVEKQSALIDLLKEAILEYNQKEHDLEIQSNSTLSQSEKEINLLRADLNSILEMDLEKIEKILEEIKTPISEKNTILRYLESIKTLLKLNKEKNTTFKIQTTQLEYIKKFFDEIDRYKEEEEKKREENKKTLEELSKISKKYKTLLGILEDKNNKEFISDLDLLALLFRESNIDETKKRKILIEVMKYNQNIFQREMKEEKISVKVERLNREDLKSLLEKYNYNFLELKDTFQDSLLNYGSLDRIEEMLKCLEKLNFPRFNLTKEGKKFITILINCREDVFTDIVKYSIEKGISKKELTFILPALVPESFGRKRGEKTSSPPNNSSPIITGKAEDYKKNVKFLESLGFQINYIYKKCKEILIMSHERLINNYNTFIAYGFTFPVDQLGSLFHPALSCLMSSNFAEIVDQFIEICPDGHDYIRRNMSRINNILSPHDLTFYNIYASYMSKDEKGDYRFPEGPFVDSMTNRKRLRGEITRYIGSGYENSPYRGLTEENKEEKTGTIKIKVENQEKFERAIEERKDTNKSSSHLLQEDDLQMLDGYIDSRDSVRYNFDGVLISRIKVNRIYNILKENNLEQEQDALLFAITYNSILTQEDFDKIKDIIKKELRQDWRK